MKDCGAASLLMIIKYYKGYISLEHLKDMLNVNKNGTTAFDIVNVANEIGFNSGCYEVKFDDFKNNNLIFPFIANVIIDNKFKHFFVVNEINYQKKYLIVSDPSKGIKKMKFDEFNSIYTGFIIMMYPLKTIPILDNEKICIYDFIKIIINSRDIIKNIVLLSIFITFFSIASSFYIECLINGLYNTNSFAFILLVFIVFLIIYILKNISELFRSKLLILINQKIDLVLTFSIYFNILSLPYHYYRNKTTGDIISRINDLDNIKNTISKILILLVVDLPLTFVSLIFLLMINTTLFLIAFIILVMYLTVTFLFKGIIEKKILDIQKDKSDVTSKMVEAISGFETVKGLKIKKYIFSLFKNKYLNLLDKNYHFQSVYLILNFIKNIINDIGFVLITFVGTTLVLKHEITLGNLLSFNALIIYFLDPIKNIISFDIDINQTKCSLKRINELNSKKKEEDISDEKLNGNIEYRNLTYAYGYNKPILKNINLSINQGEKVLLLGKSGSGKSTLLKLLVKYYSVDNDKIFIDGKDINECKNFSHIKYINQIENLFTDSLFNNLLLGNKNISNDEIKKVIDVCKLKTIIEKDSLGIYQLIEENGFNLSGGERQRIVLARTLLTDFDILIIDEGLSQVDIELEREILNNLMNNYQNKTIIVISHRTNNKELYQKIFHLNDGVLSYE